MLTFESQSHLVIRFFRYNKNNKELPRPSGPKLGLRVRDWNANNVSNGWLTLPPPVFVQLYDDNVLDFGYCYMVIWCWLFLVSKVSSAGHHGPKCTKYYGNASSGYWHISAWTRVLEQTRAILLARLKKIFILALKSETPFKVLPLSDL